MNSANPMKSLYERLAAIGVDRQFVQTMVLPDWWQDEIAQNPAGYAQAITLLSRSLGIELKSLQPTSTQISCREFGLARFKKTGRVTDEQMVWAKRLSIRAAQIASSAIDKPATLIPESASSIRQAILARGETSVNLNALLDYCWDAGIPVLHISAFPKKTRKMDGLSVRINNRPAIVISKNYKYSAWLLFILAHELGHIARKHLHGDDVLIDEQIDINTSDDEEAEAYQFAVEVLTGRPKTTYQAQRQLSALHLANAARRVYRRYQVDPGFVALNYAWHKEFMQVGNAALNLLEPNPRAVETIRSKFVQRLNWDCLSEDNAEFLRRITGANTQP